VLGCDSCALPLLRLCVGTVACLHSPQAENSGLQEDCQCHDLETMLQNRAVKNLFRQPNMGEDVRGTLNKLERGDLKLRVRALEAERALARVQIMQSVMTCTVVACTLVNMGTILSVNAMARAATASFAGAGLTSVLTLVNWLKVKNLEKKEAQLVGSG